MPCPDQSSAVGILNLEHPFYASHIMQWRRNRAAYSGGRHYINMALVKHIAEFKEAYAERLCRAYYFNFPRKVVRLLTQYVLSSRPQRENADPEIVEDFDRSGLRVDEVMRQFSINLRLYGVAWLQVDSPVFEGTATKAQEQHGRYRPYCFTVSPENVKAWAYGADCRLLWVCTEERSWNQPDPFRKGEWTTVRKLWTRADCTTVQQTDAGGAAITHYFQHNLGVVPFIRKVETDGYSVGCAHWFDDIVGISDAILNNESEAQMSIVSQMFALLVLPQDFVENVRIRLQEIVTKDAIPDEHQQKYIEQQLDLIIGRSYAITENMESKGIARYITPPGVDLDKINEKNALLVKQLYNLCCLTSDKDTKLVESAEAKQWDFQSIEQHLVTHADMLEQAEYEAWELMHVWKPSIVPPSINYNRKFSILDLTGSISALLELYGMNQNSETYQRECGKAAVTLLNRIRQLPQESMEKILKEIDAGQKNKISMNTEDVDNSGEG